MLSNRGSIILHISLASESLGLRCDPRHDGTAEEAIDEMGTLALVVRPKTQNLCQHDEDQRGNEKAAGMADRGKRENGKDGMGWFRMAVESDPDA